MLQRQANLFQALVRAYFAFVLPPRLLYTTLAETPDRRARAPYARFPAACCVHYSLYVAAAYALRVRNFERPNACVCALACVARRCWGPALQKKNNKTLHFLPADAAAGMKHSRKLPLGMARRTSCLYAAFALRTR